MKPKKGVFHTITSLLSGFFPKGIPPIVKKMIASTFKKFFKNFLKKSVTSMIVKLPLPGFLQGFIVSLAVKYLTKYGYQIGGLIYREAAMKVNIIEGEVIIQEMTDAESSGNLQDFLNSDSKLSN